MRTSKKMASQVKSQNLTEVKWFALRCFKKDDKDETGFLAIDNSKLAKQIYKIVESVDDAMKFPSVNVYGTKGFGTPKQWLEFFKGENDLSSWKFHLVVVKAPKSS